MRSKAERATTLVVCMVCVAVLHRYTIYSGLDLVQADPGDSRFIVFTLEHWYQALQGEWSVLSPPMFYPTPRTLAYSDLLVGHSIPYVVFRLMGLNPFAAFNLVMVLLSALSYGCCFWLMRKVLRLSLAASLYGAFMSALCYPKAAQLVHAQLRLDFPIPLIVGLLWQLLDTPSETNKAAVARKTAAIGVLFALLAGSSVYNAWLCALFVAVWLCLILVIAKTRAAFVCLIRRHYAVIASAALVCVPLYVLLVCAYWPVIESMHGRSWDEVVALLPSISDLTWQGTEAYVWGGVFGAFPGRLIQNWPEKRIGFGFLTTALIAASLCWGFSRFVVLAFHVKYGEHENDHAISLLLPAALSASLLLILMMIRWPSGISMWKQVYLYIPLASAIRSVSRLVLVLSLPISLGLAWGLDRVTAVAMKIPTTSQRIPLLILLGSVVCFTAAEQLCRTKRYSANQAITFLQGVAEHVSPDCPSFYLMPPKDMRAAVLTPDTFDPVKYLTANPDVRQNWKGSAWSHYELFGRREARTQEPTAGHTRQMLVPHYNLTAEMVAVMTHVPTINGYSGFVPPNFALSDPFGINTEQRVVEWLRDAGVTRLPCLIEVRLTENDIMVY